MNTVHTFAILMLMLVLTGCVQERRSASSQPQIRPRLLSNDEAARYKRVALEAAESPAMWERFKPKRVSTEPIKLDPADIQYFLDWKRFDTVEVTIPSGGSVGWHSCYIGVTVARGSYEVLGMYESFWP